MTISNSVLDNYDSIGPRRLISNPLFQVLRSLIPDRIKEVFMLCDFLVYNSEPVIASLKKFAEYPVTNIEINTESRKLHERYKTVLEEVVNLRELSILVGFDLKLYGNSFTSRYRPFVRYLACSKDGCSHRVAIKRCEYVFDTRNYKFTFKHGCSICGTLAAKLVDEPMRDTKKIRFIRWDPKDMVINYSRMAGEYEYYMRVPADVVAKVQVADKHTLATIPKEFLDTLRRKKSSTKTEVLFKFADGEVCHLRSSAPAGIEYGWGIPPVLAALNAIYHVNTLRKANEAIALERMVSFRVMHPGQRTGNGDPMSRLNLRTWVGEVKANYERFRVDPNHIMFSPVPLEVSNVGGDGKLLMSHQELEAAETNILLALGIPREFLYGGLNNLGGSITLRNLENQLLLHTAMLTKFCQWVADTVAKQTGWEKVKVSMAPFKLIDDVQQKDAIMQLNQLGLVSKKTVLSSFNLDYNDEREQIEQETIDAQAMEAAVARRSQASVNEIQEQAFAAAGGQDPSMVGNPGAMGGGGGDEVMQQAGEIFNQLVNAPYEQRKAALGELQQQDFVMYAVVSKMLEEQFDDDGVYTDPDQAEADPYVAEGSPAANAMR